MKVPHTRFFKWISAAGVIVLILLASLIQRSLNQSRAVMGLTRLDPLDNAPPMLAFTTVALGGFRGLISNILWVRATQLQDEGKYFEMVQLADWITKLQPHFVTVWIHQAWNLSYNISVKFPNHEDRWLWVQRGIELLRDHALRYNPNEPLIYRELAWQFQHKMGANLDDAHMLYKARWAHIWDGLLHGGRPDFDKLLHPQTAEEKQTVKTIRETYKMDPVVMKEVDDRYGPLEWRLPETHAIYWAYLGLKRSRHSKDDLMLRRVIFQSMQTAFLRGKMIEFPVEDPDQKGTYRKAFEFGPNIDITAKVSAAYEEMMKADPENREHIGTGHKNFLRTAVYFLYTHNRVKEAKKWYDYVRKKYPNSIPDNVTLEEYAFSRLEEEFGSTSQDRLKSMLMGLIEQSFHNLAIGQEERAQGLDLLVRKMWARFHREIGADQDVRVGLPSVRKLKLEVLREMLDPKKGLNPLLAEQLKTRLKITENDLKPASAEEKGKGQPAPTQE